MIKDEIFTEQIRTGWSCILNKKSHCAIIHSRGNQIVDAWRGIEAVITGLTRNQFEGNLTWVRIPPSPPNKPCLCIKQKRGLFISANQNLFGIVPHIFFKLQKEGYERYQRKQVMRLGCNREANLFQITNLNYRPCSILIDLYSRTQSCFARFAFSHYIILLCKQAFVNRRCIFTVCVENPTCCARMLLLKHKNHYINTDNYKTIAGPMGERIPSHMLQGRNAAVIN